MLKEPAESHIHTEEACDKGRWHKHQRHKCEYLHDLVLIEVDDTEYCVLEIFKSFKTEVGVIDKR